MKISRQQHPLPTQMQSYIVWNPSLVNAFKFEALFVQIVHKFDKMYSKK